MLQGRNVLAVERETQESTSKNSKNDLVGFLKTSLPENPDD